MLNDCLEIADSVDHAVATADPGRAHEALRQVQEQMRAALGRHGAERMEAMGQPFDPTVHEAVGVRETDQAPPGVVVDVVRAGYRVGDAVLRPARVIVSARPTGDSGG
jgi:molecular chaperone GrpE